MYHITQNLSRRYGDYSWTKNKKIPNIFSTASSNKRGSRIIFARELILVGRRVTNFVGFRERSRLGIPPTIIRGQWWGVRRRMRDCALTGKHANWNSTCELARSQARRRRGKEPSRPGRSADETDNRYSDASTCALQVAASTVRMLGTIYDSNRRCALAGRPWMLIRVTRGRSAGAAWQIQSQLYYARAGRHSAFVTRCIVCRPPRPPSSSSRCCRARVRGLFRAATLDRWQPLREARKKKRDRAYECSMIKTAEWNKM